MNSTVSENQASSFAVTCTDSNPGYFIGMSVIALNFIVLMPIQIWVLWLCTSNIRIRGRLAASEILTMNLTALEVFAIILYDLGLVAFTFSYQENILLVSFFSGSYVVVGRPFMNSLICVERYMAVAHPAIYRSPAFVKHRYIGAGLVWMLIIAYGVVAVSFHSRYTIEVYILSLTISLLVITACSLGVLKILLRPSPGETQKEGMHRQKKRAFVIITGILVCISVPYGLELFIFTIKNNISNDAFCVLLGINMYLLQPGIAIQPLLYLSKHGMFSCKTAQHAEATSS